MKKSVLFLIPDLGHGGAEKVLVNLANNLNQELFDVTVQTLFDRGVNRKYLSPHIHYKSWKKRIFRGYTHFLKIFSKKYLYNQIIGQRYDYVISFLEGTSARIVSGCPYKDSIKISWIHIELNNLKMLTTGFRNFKETYNSYNSFGRIVFVSNSVKNVFFSTFAQKIDIKTISEKSLVLYNVNETEKIIDGSKEPVDDVVFDKNQINAVSVAKLMYSKGYDRLIPAIARVNSELAGRKLHLYLLGVGEEKAKLSQIAKQYGISDKVIFLGFKENPYKYVANSDLYICSSRREGFSTAVTEALVVGTPVVSTDCSGAFELLGNNNDFGVVCQNSEEGIYSGIKYILKNDRLSYYKLKAQERGKRFSKEQTTLAVEKMLLESHL